MEFFFEGVDPAPSEGQSSDDGALVVGRAIPRVQVVDGAPLEMLSDNPADWHFDYVYARRLTWKEKASGRQWAGLIHQHHRAFGLSKLCLDPNGGGVNLERELAAPRQLINGVETEVTPIVKPGSVLVTRGHYLLHFMRRGDPGVLAVWPDLVEAAGDDVLNDALYAMMRDALERTAVSFPAPWDEWWIERRAEVERWPEEAQWALRCLTTAVTQFGKVSVATRSDGTYALTKRNARTFEAVGKKDLVSACMYCYAAFLMWLRMGDWRQHGRLKGRETFRRFRPR